MPRKGPAPRRELLPDPVHRSVVVTQLVNKVLQHGKRSTAEQIVYDALSEIERKTEWRPDPHAQARGRERPPGARGEEPPGRWRHLPGADGGAAPPGDHARDPLARRLLAPAAGEDDGGAAGRLSCSMRRNGLGAAIKRKDDLQKMAESNKAFAHYRW